LEPPSSDEDEFTRWLSQLPPDELESIRAHAAVAEPAAAFVNHVWRAHNLSAGWSLIDPLFRACWAQEWVHANLPEIRRDGWDADEVVSAFVDEAPSHDLWPHFERIQLRTLALGGDLSEWGIGAATRLHSPGVEAVVFLPPGTTEWKLGTAQRVHTFLMRHDGAAGWRVLNLVDFFPEPGWPPRLSP
jgi:hypothetical protein